MVRTLDSFHQRGPIAGWKHGKGGAAQQSESRLFPAISIAERKKTHTSARAGSTWFPAIGDGAAVS